MIIVRLLFNTLRCTRGVNIAFDRYKSPERTAANVTMISISIKIILLQDFKHQYFFFFSLSLPFSPTNYE